MATTTTINSGIHPRLRTFISNPCRPFVFQIALIMSAWRTPTPHPPSPSPAPSTTDVLRWSTVQLEASAEMIEWQHSVAISASVVAYGQFDAPNEEPAHMTLDLTLDQLLSTTRTVRKRLDLSRPVERELLEECFDLAFQAPTGGNQQG